MSDGRKVWIFDTTLRDGEQSPGCAMDIASKIAFALQLESLGVDVIEAAFPIASPGDFEAASKISQQITRSIVCGLARARKEDIESVARAFEKSKTPPRIHVFVATSDVHMENKLRKTPAEILEMIAVNVRLAKKYVDDVEFSPEDASRSGRKFFIKAIEAAVQNGARTINIPDTTGYSVGNEYGLLVRYANSFLEKKHPNVATSTHCHNDLGNAVANTLAGLKAGASQAECCVLGIGERAGNAQLEAVVMSLKTRFDYYGLRTNISTKELGKTARLLSSIIGKPIPDNCSVVGPNAFSHGAGIHFDGVQKDRHTYEIMNPEDVGWKGDSSPLVKHSGRHALKHRLEILGYSLEKDILEEVYKKFVVLADSKKLVHNNDLYMMVQEVLVTEEARKANLFLVRRVDYHRTDGKISVHITLSRNGDEFEASGTGNGPTDAVGDAVNKIILRQKVLKTKAELKSFNIGKSDGGLEALGLVTLCVHNNGKLGYGRGSDTDIIVASAKAFVSSVNHLLQCPVGA
jgi:2-isopropylmalate synthase